MKKSIIAVICIFCLGGTKVRAQEVSGPWDLKKCIDYALQQNIQVRRSKIAWEESVENTRQAREQLFPSLSFSGSNSLVNRPETLEGDKNSYTGNYGFNSSVTLYNGGKLTRNVRQQGLQDEIQQLYIRESENEIELAIIEGYLQVLYADESVNINRNTLEVSKAQCERARELLKAGSISRSDLAQLESQYSADNYQLVTAEATLEEQKLVLKQLLELSISDEISLVIPELNEENVLYAVPAKQLVYERALEIMPQIESKRLSIEVAELDKQNARSGYLPTLDLTAGIGTGHTSGSDYSYGKQLKNSFNESVGITLNLPIYSRRQNKTAVKLAALKIEDASLEYLDVQKDLLKTVETVYLDAVSSQNRYKAALESLKASQVSFELTEEQFNLGMKNTVELLTEKNNWLSAQQEMIQAKYMAVLNRLFLNFYQGEEINMK